MTMKHFNTLNPMVRYVLDARLELNEPRVAFTFHVLVERTFVIFVDKSYLLHFMGRITAGNDKTSFCLLDK